MKNYKLLTGSILLMLIVFLLPGCTAIAGIFKAGMWTGILIVGFVVFLVIYFLSRGSRK